MTSECELNQWSIPQTEMQNSKPFGQGVKENYHSDILLWTKT